MVCPSATPRHGRRRGGRKSSTCTRDIYGRIPGKTPKVKWQVSETDTAAREGTAVKKRIVGTVGDAADAPRVNLTVYTPSNAKMPVPLILLVNFGGDAATPPANAPPGDPPV